MKLLIGLAISTAINVELGFYVVAAAVCNEAGVVTRYTLTPARRG